MNTKLSQLSSEEKAVLARLKAWLALQLAAEAVRNDEGLRQACPAAGISLKLAIRGAGAGMQLVVKNGIARVYSVGWPQLVLFFPGSASAIRVLSGSKGTAVPLPLRPGAFKALGFFRKASSRATELLRGAETPEDVRARLLLAATLYGLEAVAGDTYLARRMQIIPDGVVAVRAGEIEYFVEKRGNAIHVIEAQQRPDAVLSFADYQSAIDVLSGKRQAVVALGSGKVRIEGLLPLVQGLFGVLDRLSWYLGVAL
jgi:Putative sterol carrier protein